MFTWHHCVTFRSFLAQKWKYWNKWIIFDISSWRNFGVLWVPLPCIVTTTLCCHSNRYFVYIWKRTSSVLYWIHSCITLSSYVKLVWKIYKKLFKLVVSTNFPDSPRTLIRQPILFKLLLRLTCPNIWATSWENLFYDICEQQRCRSVLRICAVWSASFTA